MSGLSGSQAAATLATTLVGSKLGLFDKTTINAVLVVILASLVITPALVSLFGKRVPSAVEDDTKLGKTVLVPVWGDSSRSAVRLAGRLTTDDGGIAVAASFASSEATPSELKAQRSLSKQAEEWLARDGLESRTLFRVSRTVPEGLLETILSENATLLVTRVAHAREHRARQRSGRALARSPVPTLMTHGDVEFFDRVLIVVRRDSLVRPGRHDLELAAQLGSRVAQDRPIVVVAAGTDHGRKLFTTAQDAERIESHDPIDWIKNNLQKTDLVFFAGLDAAREALARVPSLAKAGFSWPWPLTRRRFRAARSASPIRWWRAAA